MKPAEKKPQMVYRIIDRSTGRPVGSYSRSCHDEYDFESADEARKANCHGIFEDQDKYAIAKYKVTYELLNPEVKTPNRKPPDPEPNSMAEWIAKDIIKSFYEGLAKK